MAAEALKNLRFERSFPSFVVSLDKINAVAKLLAKHELRPEGVNMKTMVDDPAGKRILIAESATELPSDVIELIGPTELTAYSVSLDYRNVSLHDLLQKQLPDLSVIPANFETVGTLARLCLHDEHLPHKSVIGEAILLKNRGLKTVVAKVGKIDSVYRAMALDLIAGEDNFVTEVKQAGLRFRLDFSKVYWNSRLEHEHDLLVESFTEGAIVADAMCGIGPFAIRAALRRKCKVLANDLNPDSHKWLVENVKVNRCGDAVKCFNMDAREFIKMMFRDGGSDYLVMNLPATAVEFLDAVDAAANEFKETTRMPIVHFYAFSESTDDGHASIMARAKMALNRDPPDIQLKRVRDVSPKKFMFRCSFSASELVRE